MGSIVLNHVPSDHIDSRFNMRGATVNPSESLYRSSSRPPSQAPLETARSGSTSSNTTPTSTTAPPCTSAVGSARISAQSQNDLPPYVNRQDRPSAPSTRSAGTPAFAHPAAAPSMTSAPSSHAFPPDYSSSSNTAQYPPSGNHATAMATESMTSAPYVGAQPSPASPQLHPTFPSMQSLGVSEASSPSRIRVHSLSHIQSLASEEFLAQSQRSQIPGQGLPGRQFEISSMPVTDIIEMVAGLLTKITTTNDMHHEHIHRHIPPPDGTTNLSPQATSVLAFHGKNVPSITILSYLTRIHKYCPTTYEVFLSLLIYFDRMTELVNRGQLSRLLRRWEAMAEAENLSAANSLETRTSRHAQNSPMVTPPASERMTAQDVRSPSASMSPALYPQAEDDNLSHFFVVDSFNIHRLVIAGVTCASKFFSDVFYTNSRYAKVGGLPLVELNHLELQFLLLNDFRLAIPVEELEAYGTMLVEFYAREVVAQQQQQAMAVPRAINPPTMADSYSDAMYMRSRDKRDQSDVGQTPTPP